MRRALLILLSVAALSACSTWLGDTPDPPLPGKRLSVLVHQQEIAPDPEVADAKIALPPPVKNADWPQAGGYPNHAMHHLAAPAVLGPAWNADIGSGTTDTLRLNSSPIVANGRVFTMDSESVVSAFNAANGDRLWRASLAPDGDAGNVGGGIAYGAGRVFVSTGFAQVLALNSANGKVLWRTTVDGPLRAAPTYRGGRLFTITVDNKLYALDASNGKTLWTNQGVDETASLLGGASPAVDSGIVVAPYSSGELVALRVENGHQVWRDSLVAVRRTDIVSDLGHVRGRPVIDRGIVIAVSHGGLTGAFELRSGRRIWEKEIGGIEDPWVAGDYVYLITNDADLVCLSRRHGSIYWVHSLPHWEDEKNHKDPIIWTGPLLAGNRLIVTGSNGEVLAVSPYSGKILGKDTLPDGVSVPPVVAGGTVYFLTNDAELIAYR